MQTPLPIQKNNKPPYHYCMFIYLYQILCEPPKMEYLYAQIQTITQKLYSS